MEKRTKRVIALLGCLVVLACFAIPCFASGSGEPSVSTSDIGTVLEPIKSQFSVSNITTFIAYIIGAAVVFAFLWWGVRKGWKALMAAVTKGKAKF